MADAFAELRRFSALLGRRLGDVAAAVAAGDHGPVVIDHSGRPTMLLIRRFDRHTLARLRRAVGAVIARHGLPDQQAVLLRTR
jgi:hypothetical protein